MSENYKYLYLMLSRTNTSISRLIKHNITGTFTHSALSFDRELTEMYSFARRRPHNFLVAGFVHENLDRGVYSWNHDAPCRLYRIRVTEKQYDSARAMIDDFMLNYKKHTYNMAGLFAIKYNKVLRRKHKYVCTQFVSKVLLDCGIATHLKKNMWLMQPDDLMELEGLELIYEGRLGDIREEPIQRKLEFAPER